MKQLNKEEQLEILWKKFNIFYLFFKKYNPTSHGLEGARSIALNAYNKKKLTNLKQMVNEANSWLRDSPKEDQAIIKQIIKDEIGIDIDEEKRLTKIDRIVKKGKINSAKDYELILNRVEEIYDDSNLEEHVKTLNNLLADFHRN